jgi:nucleotidyltransferase substrate binding protein (TIGR01987 family)
MSDDIRWKQRYENFQKALTALEEAVNMNEYSTLERDGLIQRFEFTLELAWKTLQDLIHENGHDDINGPKPTAQQAFADGYIIDHDGWKKMLDSRTTTAHEYSEEKAELIVKEIKTKYYPLLDDLDKKLTKEAGK